jgi:hypothetical protein
MCLYVLSAKTWDPVKNRRNYCAWSVQPGATAQLLSRLYNNMDANGYSGVVCLR